MSANKVKIIQKNIGLLDVNLVKIFEKLDDGTLIELKDRTGLDFKLLRKLMGFALQTVRSHGVNIQSWSHLEIDSSGVSDPKKSESDIEIVDVHFMMYDKVTVSLLGIPLETEGKTTHLEKFECITIQPK